MTMDGSVSEAVLSAVADREGVGPEELGTPLYDVIDPEALDNLFRNGSGRVTFEYMNYVVTVDNRGTVRVEAGDEW